LAGKLGGKDQTLNAGCWIRAKRIISRPSEIRFTVTCVTRLNVSQIQQVKNFTPVKYASLLFSEKFNWASRASKAGSRDRKLDAMALES